MIRYIIIIQTFGMVYPSISVSSALWRGTFAGTNEIMRCRSCKAASKYGKLKQNRHFAKDSNLH